MTELHQRHGDAEEALEDLLRADWRVRVGYRRRREQVEREAEQEATRREMERLRRRARRVLKRKEAAATTLERQGRLKRGRQTSIEEAMRGDIRSADVAAMAEAVGGAKGDDDSATVPGLRAATVPGLRAATVPSLRAATVPSPRAATVQSLRAATVPSLRAATVPSLRAATMLLLCACSVLTVVARKPGITRRHRTQCSCV